MSGTLHPQQLSGRYWRWVDDSSIRSLRLTSALDHNSRTSNKVHMLYIQLYSAIWCAQFVKYPVWPCRKIIYIIFECLTKCGQTFCCTRVNSHYLFAQHTKGGRDGNTKRASVFTSSPYRVHTISIFYCMHVTSLSIGVGRTLSQYRFSLFNTILYSEWVYMLYLGATSSILIGCSQSGVYKLLLKLIYIVNSSPNNFVSKNVN